MAILDVRELISMAVKDEETGIAFYDALAGKTTNAEVKAKLAEFAEQEKGHAARFRGMLEEIGDYTPVGDYDEQYQDYVRSLLQQRAFPTPDEAAAKARAVESDAEALEIAMRMEKDTLGFLAEMKNYVKPEMMQYVDDVIAEERDHVIAISGLMKTLG
jgi:rubrerythrin